MGSLPTRFVIGISWVWRPLHRVWRPLELSVFVPYSASWMHHLACWSTTLSASCLFTTHLSVSANHDCTRVSNSQYKWARYVPVSEQLEGDGASMAGLEDDFTLWNHFSLISWDDDTCTVTVKQECLSMHYVVPRSYAIHLCLWRCLF